VIGPLVETKLYIPNPRRTLVMRPRLMERLRHGAESKLTLISAPAGFGKTTLMAGWLATAPASEGSTSWLSLDPADNQPVTFWTYLIAALQKVSPGVGATALSLLQDPQPPPIETTLTMLLNELSEAPNELVLVLDDYHAADASEIQDGMAFLLEHLPPRMHLVIATRADPALPLGRLRGRGELTEIRAADLRFTPDEANAYLNEVMGLELRARDIEALEGRTEGWIAALQLAALSMQGRDDVAGFIAGFAGDDRYIVDYLVEEVLQRQSEAVRSFLLQTSILSQLTGPLCDAVTGHVGGKAMLESLDRGNLFIVPLDDRRRWYRYHHLFADVLRARLLDERPDRIPELHRRACDWYELNGDRSEAIRHALAGEDFERAAKLIELSLPALRQARQVTTMRRWLEALPRELLQVRPVLGVGYVGALMANGELQEVEGLLADAERWLDTTRARRGPDEQPTAMVVADEDGFRRLPGTIALYRAAQARLIGDEIATLAHARRALDLAAEDDHLERGAAAGFLALAQWTSGDLEAAHRSWTDAMASLLKAGHVVDAIGCARALADIRMAQGRLHDAMSAYERGLQLATEPRAAVLRGAADMHVGMSELHFEWGDLEVARQRLASSSDLGEQAGLPQYPYRWRIAMARIRQAEGDSEGALVLLDEAERRYVSEYYPDVRPVAALRTRIWTVQGRVGDAIGWAHEHELSVGDDLAYLREFEYITLARVLMARSRLDGDARSMRDALGLLERLLSAAELAARGRSVIEVLVLQALAHQSNGDVPAALRSLERALTLAQPEGYVRIFVDEGPPMAALLETAARGRIAAAYARHLLGRFGRAEDEGRVTQALVEPLSERELEVLRLLASDLDGPDIARELVVALSTIRSHTKSIYAKLGVNNRRAAVRRGEQLGLLSRSRDAQPHGAVLHDA
jgi:LuxR family transcriptional regulator, maltose regulon positive regulatory protein